MHAVFIPVTFNDRSAAEGELKGLVAQTSGLPGFVAGYWVATAPDKGISVVVFEDEDAARALGAQAQDSPSGSVTVGDIEHGEVLAYA
jgi:hypothetical protein